MHCPRLKDAKPPTATENLSTLFPFFLNPCDLAHHLLMVMRKEQSGKRPGGRPQRGVNLLWQIISQEAGVS